MSGKELNFIETIPLKCFILKWQHWVKTQESPPVGEAVQNAILLNYGSIFQPNFLN